MKIFGLIALEKEISGQITMDSLVGLLIFTLTKIYNEKKQA